VPTKCLGHRNTANTVERARTNACVRACVCVRARLQRLVHPSALIKRTKNPLRRDDPRAASDRSQELERPFGHILHDNMRAFRSIFRDLTRESYLEYRVSLHEQRAFAPSFLMICIKDSRVAIEAEEIATMHRLHAPVTESRCIDQHNRKYNTTFKGNLTVVAYAVGLGLRLRDFFGRLGTPV
jgi:hypothetical protein